MAPRVPLCLATVVFSQCRIREYHASVVQPTKERGAPLRGLAATPTLEAHVERLKAAGWQQAWAVDMDTVYRNHLPPSEKQRIERLELFDEFEEWHMI